MEGYKRLQLSLMATLSPNNGLPQVLVQVKVADVQKHAALQSKRTLVEGYKRLRSEDAVPGSSTSYRITVRQLEALVRLSEALARLRCTDTIVPQYVREVSPRSSRSLGCCSADVEVHLIAHTRRDALLLLVRF